MDKKENDPTIGSLQETYFRFKNTTILKAEGWEKISHANSN